MYVTGACRVVRTTGRTSHRLQRAGATRSRATVPGRFNTRICPSSGPRVHATCSSLRSAPAEPSTTPVKGGLALAGGWSITAPELPDMAGSIKKRPNGKYRARYRDATGRERAKHFDRKLDAERWLAATQVSVARGEWLDPLLGRITVQEWSQMWLAGLSHLNPSTKARYRGLLRTSSRTGSAFPWARSAMATSWRGWRCWSMPGWLLLAVPGSTAPRRREAIPHTRTGGRPCSGMWPLE